MRIEDTELDAVKLLVPRRHGDARGWLAETWHAARFDAAGVRESFVQENQSLSRGPVLRGLHYQLRQAQGKLVRCLRGRVFDVAVDLRRSSSEFGRWTGRWLSASEGEQLWVPPGFAHGFLALEDEVEVLYKCTDYHAPEYERVLLWSDPRLGIRWPLGDCAPRLSERDRAGLPLDQAEVYP
jgi:dTDP-4-dehydrorhamnose 3,5-epimerase